MPKKRRSILREKWTEALTSVLPITLLVFLICFVLVPVPNNAMMGFIIGAALLVLGMGLFTLGTDLAMTPLITIQILGVYYRIKQRGIKRRADAELAPDEDIIDL